MYRVQKNSNPKCFLAFSRQLAMVELKLVLCNSFWNLISRDPLCRDLGAWWLRSWTWDLQVAGSTHVRKIRIPRVASPVGVAMQITDRLWWRTAAENRNAIFSSANQQVISAVAFLLTSTPSGDVSGHADSLRLFCHWFTGSIRGLLDIRLVL